MTDPLGQSQVLPYISGLTKAGYTFHLISFEKKDKFEKHKNHIQSICDEAGINWHPQDYIHKGGPFGTRSSVKRMRDVAIYLHKIHNFSLVHCRSYIPALVGLKLQKQGVKFVFDMRGFWADERVDGGLWNLKNPIYRLIYNYFKRKEKQFIRHADYVISLTNNGKSEIESWPETPKDVKIQVIPCCADLKLFDSKQISDDSGINRRRELDINPESFVLGYVGSIGTWYMLPEMLDFFKVLREKRKDATFLFVTGENRENLIKAAALKGIPEDAIRSVSVLHNEVPEMISLMNASVFFIRPTYSKKASSPTKQGEIMAMGVPLICNSNVGDTDEIVKKYHSGVVVEDFSENAYLKAIDQLGVFDSEAIIEGAHAYFSLSEGVKNYQYVYSSVLE